MSEFSKEERETIINFNEAAATASIYTHNRAIQNKLNKLREEYNIEVVDAGDGWTEYLVPKKWVRVAPPRQVNYTEEQRAAMAERLAATRNK